MNKNAKPPTTDYSTNAISSIAGPLVVSKANPRYFTIASEPDRKAIYLTGSHIWNNFHDGMGPGSDCAEVPEKSDFDAYLAFLKEHNHNFIRLAQFFNCVSGAGGGSVDALDYHARVRHLHIYRGMLRLSDKFPFVTSTGRERLFDGMEMTRIARGVSREQLEAGDRRLLEHDACRSRLAALAPRRRLPQLPRARPDGGARGGGIPAGLVGSTAAAQTAPRSREPFPLQREHPARGCLILRPARERPRSLLGCLGHVLWRLPDASPRRRRRPPHRRRPGIGTAPDRRPRHGARGRRRRAPPHPPRARERRRRRGVHTRSQARRKGRSCTRVGLPPVHLVRTQEARAGCPGL